MELSPTMERLKERFSIEEPADFFDPTVIPNEALEDDLTALKLDIKEAESKVDEKDEKYEALLDKAAEAAEWKQDDILQEAGDVEDVKKMWQSIWRERRDIRRLIKANMSFRERTSTMDGDLNMAAALQSADATELRSHLESALSDHLTDQRTIRSLTQKFTDAREIGDESRSGHNLEKHRQRMEARQEGRDSVGDAREEDSDEERSADAD
jgi:hypothetical protein